VYLFNWQLTIAVCGCAWKRGIITAVVVPHLSDLLLLLLTAVAEGGTVAVSLQECSHAVLRHKQQAAHAAALGAGCSIVTAEWVLLSAVRQELQPQVMAFH
jgi:hypothetical protein